METGRGRLSTPPSVRVDAMDPDPGIREHRALCLELWPVEARKALSDKENSDGIGKGVQSPTKWECGQVSK